MTSTVVRLPVSLDAGLDVDERVTAAADDFGERDQRLLDLLRVIPVAHFNLDDWEQLLRRQIPQLAFDIDGGYSIAVSLLQREGDDEIAAVGRELGDR